MYLNSDMTEAEREERLARPVDVYVPRPGSVTHELIHPASGIVGTERDEGVLLHYEGALYEPVNLKTFADRVLSAHGRWALAYPTTATHLAEASEVVRVGTFDPSEGRVTVIDDDALARWLGVERVVEDELVTTTGRGAMRRRVAAILDAEGASPDARRWAEKKARELGLER